MINVQEARQYVKVAMNLFYKQCDLRITTAAIQGNQSVSVNYINDGIRKYNLTESDIADVSDRLIKLGFSVAVDPGKQEITIYWSDKD